MKKQGAIAESANPYGDEDHSPGPLIGSARHLWAMDLSDQLRQVFRRMHRPQATMIDAKDIIALLNQAEVKFVLMGTHAVSGYRDEPRATQDVDILVQKRHHRKAVRALQKAFPDLVLEDYEVVTRFIDPAVGKSIIDLIRPVEPVHQAVFKHSVAVAETHQVPDLEMILVCKYAAMISLTRPDDKKHVDIGDFINMVRTNQAKIDIKKLRQLGETVYTGGGAEVVKYVEDVKAGRSLRV